MLYVADKLQAPSHLWMRRLLDAVISDVAVLATDAGPPTPLPGRTRIAIFPSQPPILNRALNRIGLLAQSPWKSFRSDWMTSLLELRQVTVALVHFATTALLYESAWCRTDKPVFIHCHGWDVSWEKRSHDGQQHTHDEAYLRRVLGLPKNVSFIANSLFTKAKLTAIGVREERIAVKHLGVQIPASPKMHACVPECTILYLGRLIDCKGPDQVIRAFELACERGLKGKLLIAGDGPLRITCELMRARSRFADRIELLGAVSPSKAEALRAKADIFTAHNCCGPLTAQEEAFGVSIVEAMAAGLPVVTGRNGALPEVITSGLDGILIEPGDIELHAKEFIRLANSVGLRQRIGDAAWRTAKQRFSIEREASDLRRIMGLA